MSPHEPPQRTIEDELAVSEYSTVAGPTRGRGGCSSIVSMSSWYEWFWRLNSKPNSGDRKSRVISWSSN